ncbi:hypothetical protein MVEN_02165600 [Mycena venus]|uniref:DUF6535 domain-containing protein n=1 Tax=Mycena venus TaxID=2733690 RepID=A0A8H6X8Z3_9AGAR|nr:hypothetical protein MVEN_02165600 [Mycena venus]
MDREKGEFTDIPVPNKEVAAAKIWAIYVSEAEKYDRSLVESWKSDMEGLLIFAALFSAILTAFLIESYKSLNPDSGDLTVHLLGQISQQIAASANGSTFHVLPSSSFTPPASAFICNALWFISLGFSLTCALIATFVQQWTRDFLHKADMRSAPIIQARIFSFLYYGLRRFRMHTVVDVIPLLLHGSLFLFFCGLVAFLVPVNIAMSMITAAILSIVAAVYCTLTVLPLQYLDCPYRTPLSGIVWRAFQDLQMYWTRRHSRNSLDAAGTRSDASVESSPIRHAETMVEAMSRAATEVSEERLERDYRSLVWTMKSLADDAELEPLIEAIPDLLCGPTYWRDTYEGHIRRLIHNSDVGLLHRIVDFLGTCYTGVLSVEASQRRIIISCKAFWAIASLSTSYPASPALDLSDIYIIIHSPRTRNLSISPYFLSAAVMMLWSTFLAIQGDLIKCRDYLAALEGDPRSEEGCRELDHVSEFLVGIHGKFYTLGIVPWMPGVHGISYLRSLAEEYLSEIPYRIMLNFLVQSVTLDCQPYRWEETRTTIRLSHPVPASLTGFINAGIDNAILSQVDRLSDATADMATSTWIDDSVADLVSFWEPDDTYRIPHGLIALLNHRPSVFNHQAYGPKLNISMAEIKIRLWECFQRSLSTKVFEIQREAFTAMWHLAAIDLLHYAPIRPPGSPFESVLKALLMAESRFVNITCSVVALWKVQILRDHEYTTFRTMGEAMQCLNHQLFPEESMMYLPGEFRSMQSRDELSAGQLVTIRTILRHRLLEARLDNVSEYLEYCTSGLLPYNAVETVDRMKDRDYLAPQGPIHPTHQMRLANSITNISPAGRSVEILHRVINCAIWDVYAGGDKSEEQLGTHSGKLELTLVVDDRPHEVSPPSFGDLWPWLDNPIAREKIQTAFTVYEGRLSSNVDCPADTLSRLRGILRGIEYWHKLK